jgi:hypothetical protein
MRRSSSARHQLAVVGADHRGVERAFEFLRVLLLAEIALGERKLACGNEAGIACLEHEAEPASFRLRAPPLLEGAALSAVTIKSAAGPSSEPTHDGFPGE